jgi:hypothetical protein
VSDDLEEQLENIKPEMLTPIVRSVLESDTVEIVKWSYETMQGGYGGNTSIYRLFGTGLDRGRGVSWSLILKVLRRGDQVDDPTHFKYWKREFLLVESGILDNLPGNLTAPRCLGVFEPSDRECWIWLEEIDDE